jgi:para-aminobenzoate synthetase component 1
MFGHIAYSLTQETLGIHSRHVSPIGFDDLYFAVPEYVLECTTEWVVVYAASHEAAQRILDEIHACEPLSGADKLKASLEPRLQKQQYIGAIEALMQHIRRGDCYEINYCHEFTASNYSFHPLDLYQQLAQVSPNPFSCYYKKNDLYLACASPERFVMRSGNRILSQPIKGTAPRQPNDRQKDDAAAEALRESPKDKMENVMVVDLVRNDLSMVCEPGSVFASELFGIYSYPQVHQMISTIAGELKPGIEVADVMGACYPMGSMTGAPKKRVAELIDAYEVSARGIFSGTVGYIRPDGQFDFNVVIRSVSMNRSKKLLSFHVGSGITNASSPALEYEECMWKAQAMKRVLEG